MKRNSVVGCLVVFAGLLQPALADTLLRLSESAHIAVKPDELAASLRASAAAPTASAAQAQVNVQIGKALDLARQNAGIMATTGSYQVWQTAQPASQWHASQAIDLRSSDGAAMLKLVGELQSQGLGLERLAWQVTPQAARAAESEATKMAIGNLRQRAAEAASILGLKFVSFKEVRLDANRASPVPMARMVSSAMAAGAPPRAEAEDADIQSSVEADAVLAPIQP